MHSLTVAGLWGGIGAINPCTTYSSADSTVHILSCCRSFAYPRRVCPASLTLVPIARLSTKSLQEINHRRRKRNSSRMAVARADGLPLARLTAQVQRSEDPPNGGGA